MTVSTPSASPADRLRGIVPDAEIAALGPLIEQIEQLKAERNAVVLAHNYMTPDIFHGVSDLKGDSLALARMATETEADVIVSTTGAEEAIVDLERMRPIREASRFKPVFILDLGAPLLHPLRNS